MSDAFLKSMLELEVGSEIVYHAADPQSQDKVVALIDMLKYDVSVKNSGRTSKITIKRKTT